MRKELLLGIAGAALILAAAAVLRYAQSIDAVTAETARRGIQVVIGLWFAAYANRMPKQIGAFSSVGAARRSQAVLRVGGWSLTVAGICHVVLWTLAPLPVARVAATAVVAIATLVTLVYGAWTMARCRAASGPAMMGMP